MIRKITEVMQDMGMQLDGAFWTSGLQLLNDWGFQENNYEVVFYDGSHYPDGLWRVGVYGLKYDTNGKDWTVDEDNIMWFTENERKVNV